MSSWPLLLPTFVFLHTSSSYAKILGETNFQPREFPRSGSKAEDGERRETSGGTRKAAWAKKCTCLFIDPHVNDVWSTLTLIF